MSLQGQINAFEGHMSWFELEESTGRLQAIKPGRYEDVDDKPVRPPTRERKTSFFQRAPSREVSSSPGKPTPTPSSSPNVQPSEDSLRSGRIINFPRELQEVEVQELIYVYNKTQKTPLEIKARKCIDAFNAAEAGSQAQRKYGEALVRYVREFRALDQMGLNVQAEVALAQGGRRAELLKFLMARIKEIQTRGAHLGREMYEFAFQEALRLRPDDSCVSFSSRLQSFSPLALKKDQDLAALLGRFYWDRVDEACHQGGPRGDLLMLLKERYSNTAPDLREPYGFLLNAAVELGANDSFAPLRELYEKLPMLAKINDRVLIGLLHTHEYRPIDGLQPMPDNTDVVEAFAEDGQRTPVPVVRMSTRLSILNRTLTAFGESVESVKQSIVDQLKALHGGKDTRGSHPVMAR